MTDHKEHDEHETKEPLKPVEPVADDDPGAPAPGGHH